MYRSEASRSLAASQVENRTSVASVVPSHDRDRARHSIRASSLTTQSSVSAYECYDVPHLIKTPWELERRKRNSAWRRTKTENPFPARMFKNLPREVYDCIVEQVQKLHLGQDQPCPPCYLKDLYNLSLTSRAWDKAVTVPMYVISSPFFASSTRLPPPIKTTSCFRWSCKRIIGEARVNILTFLRKPSLRAAP